MSAIAPTIERQKSRPWWLRLSDFSFFAMFLCVTFPETVLGTPYVGPIPGHFFVFYLGLIGLFVEQMVSRQPLPKLVSISLTIWFLLLIHGALRGGSVKWMAIDASSLMGFIAGAYWVSRRPMELVLRQWQRLGMVVTFLLFLALLGLATGFVKPAIESGRIYVYSVFRAAALLSIIMPLLWAGKAFFPIRGLPTWLFGAPFVGALLMIWIAAYFTATRSILLEGTLSCVLILRIQARKAPGVALLLGTFLVLTALTLWDLDALPNLVSGNLGERLQKTMGYKETRFIEVMMLLEQMSAYDYLAGMGMGSRFHSVVFVDGTDLAINPHVAIFTYLQKGGLPLFLAAVMIPALGSLLRLFRPRARGMELGCLSILIVYFVMASISGGWEFFFIFLYGAAMQMLMDRRWETVPGGPW